MEEENLHDETTNEIAEPSGPEYVVKNRVRAEDAAVHNWYRFVLGYPPHLVREYLESLEADPLVDWVFDPFCGTGTTPVEARLQGFPAIGLEANPVVLLATRVKLAWDIDLDQVGVRLDEILPLATACLRNVDLTPIPEGIRQLPLFDPWVPAKGTGGIEHDFVPAASLIYGRCGRNSHDRFHQPWSSRTMPAFWPHSTALRRLALSSLPRRIPMRRITRAAPGWKAFCSAS